MPKPPYPYRIAGRGPGGQPRAGPVGARVGPGAGAADDEHPDLGAVFGAVRDLPGGHRGGFHRAGRPGPDLGLVGARVVAHHRRGRRVVGVGEPGLVAAFRPFARPADGARSRQRNGPGPRPRRQIVHGDLADRVARPHDEQHRPRRLLAVEDGITLQDGLGIGGDEVLPSLRTGVRRIRDRAGPGGRRRRCTRTAGRPARPGHRSGRPRRPAPASGRGPTGRMWSGRRSTDRCGAPYRAPR